MTRKKRGNTAEKHQEWWDKQKKKKNETKEAWRRASRAGMRLSHHNVLNTLPSQQLAGHEVRQTWTFSLQKKKEKPECFRHLVKREFIIQLPAYCWREKVSCSSSTLDSEKGPANIFSLSSPPAAGVIPWSALDVPARIFFLLKEVKKEKVLIWST